MSNDDTQWQPRINQERCKGCAYCVEICPTDALTISLSKAYLTFPDRCSYCFACEDACPQMAIELPLLIVKSAQSRTTKI